MGVGRGTLRPCQPLRPYRHPSTRRLRVRMRPDTSHPHHKMSVPRGTAPEYLSARVGNNKLRCPSTLANPKGSPRENPVQRNLVIRPGCGWRCADHPMSKEIKGVFHSIAGVTVAIASQGGPPNFNGHYWSKAPHVQSVCLALAPCAADRVHGSPSRLSRSSLDFSDTLLRQALATSVKGKLPAAVTRATPRTPNPPSTNLSNLDPSRF